MNPNELIIYPIEIGACKKNCVNRGTNTCAINYINKLVGIYSKIKISPNKFKLIEADNPNNKKVGFLITSNSMPGGYDNYYFIDNDGLYALAYCLITKIQYEAMVEFIKSIAKEV